MVAPRRPWKLGLQKKKNWRPVRINGTGRQMVDWIFSESYCRTKAFQNWYYPYRFLEFVRWLRLPLRWIHFAAWNFLGSLR